MQINKTVVTHAASSVCLMLLIGVVHKHLAFINTNEQVHHTFTPRRSKSQLMTALVTAICRKSLLVSRLCLWSTLQSVPTGQKRERHRQQYTRTKGKLIVITPALPQSTAA